MVRFHDSLKPLLTPLTELRPHPDNARNGDVDSIVESMRVNGVYRPLMAQRSTGYVLAGNHQYAALHELGSDRAAVVWLDVDDAEARRILLADNRTSDIGRYDDSLLAGLLQDAMGEGGLAGTGYDEDDLAGLLALLDHDGPMFSDDDQHTADEQAKAAWPKIAFQVPPDMYQEWQALAGDDVERLRMLLDVWASTT